MSTDLADPRTTPAEDDALVGERGEDAGLNSFLQELLAEQGRLDTPVARFARGETSGASGPTPGALHSSLIPLSAPGPGEQYAFEVDLDACTGCKSCVAACHALNGLDETETWRDVGLLVSADQRHPFQQTVTTACHHCADPGCLNGCPVLAYEKDPLTGIVRHLDDQCIGCSYCILKCPYDVPKYSARLGIVRKCDLCHGRLSNGEAPACAQACPTQAIRVVIATTPSRDAAPEPFLPGAPDPRHTHPTTRYVSRRPLPARVVPADFRALRPQPAHWPLVFLLTLMPLAVGCSVAAAFATRESSGTPLACAAWVAGTLGLALSVSHLGQPLRAWRIFLGLRRSWLSREAVVFGAWFFAASATVATRLHVLRTAESIAPVAAAALGVAGLFCSVMIYADTPREFWAFRNTAARFFGTAAVLGIGVALACRSLAGLAEPGGTAVLGWALAGGMALKLLLETRALAASDPNAEPLTPAVTTARLLSGPLRAANELRIACGVLGGIALPVLVATQSAPAWLAWPGLAVAAAGELVERSLFFRAVVAPKMPGVPQ